MGFWTKLNVFGATRSARSGPAKERRAKAAPAAGVAKIGNGASSGGPDVAVAEPPSRIDLHDVMDHHSRFDDSGDLALLNEDDQPVHIPRNRQELFEELQKNYREVVDLIRRVNTHLDREQVRSERLMVIAERVEQLVPSLHDMPDAINEHATKLNRDIIEVIREGAAGEERRTQRLENALNGISTQLSEGSNANADLAHTMAQFRESISELTSENARTGASLREANERSASREQEMVKLLSGSRRWGAIGVVISLGVAAMAVAGAIVAIVVTSG